jgi:L-iditol 2-dehydrogenase
MTEPAAVALHALRRAGGTGPGQRVAVFGAGPIGMMVAQWARAMGASRIFLFDLMPQKLALAREMGFDLAFNSRETEPDRTIQAETGYEGVHLSIEAAGVPQTFTHAIAATMRGGRMVILGNPSADVTLPAGLISQLMRRELTLYGTWNSEYSAAGNDDDWQTVLASLASGAINLAPLITHRVRLAEAFAALQMMKEQREFFSKVLVVPGEEGDSAR